MCKSISDCNLFYWQHTCPEKRNISARPAASTEVCHHSIEPRWIRFDPKSAEYFLQSSLYSERKLCRVLCRHLYELRPIQPEPEIGHTWVVTVMSFTKHFLWLWQNFHCIVIRAASLARGRWSAESPCRTEIGAAAWGSHFPVSAPPLIGEKNYTVKNAAV